MTPDGTSTAPQDAVDLLLAQALKTLAPPGVLIAHRVILPGDENALLAAEAASLTSSIPELRRASGAARKIARELLATLGYGDFAILKGTGGEPLWPVGISGSLAHDDQVAVAALGLKRDVGAIGIDIEPANPLPAEMIDLVATPTERRLHSSDLLMETMLFAAKEAVYKAVYPIDQKFLEFHDIEIDLAERTAVTTTGWTFKLRFWTGSRIVMLALG